MSVRTFRVLPLRSLSVVLAQHAAQRQARRETQRGATLIVGLIMVALITLLVINAFTMSSSNLKMVNNMQVRDEALAAANQALEQVISSPFTNALGTQTFNIDLNKDGTTDYVAQVAQPVCLKVQPATAASPSDVELGMAMTSSAYYFVDWELGATVTDAASGASVTIREGVRLRMSQSQKDTACP